MSDSPETPETPETPAEEPKAPGATEADAAGDGPPQRLAILVSVLLVLLAALAVLISLPDPKPPEEHAARPAASMAPRAQVAVPPLPPGIPKLDVHTHTQPGAVHSAHAFLQSRGIGRAVNLSGGIAGGGLEETLAAAKSENDFFLVFANVRFEGIGTPGWAAREVAGLEKAKALGAKGVKIGKNLGLAVKTPDGKRVAVDDASLDPVFDAAGRLGLPVAIHVGDPRAFFDPPTDANERIDELRAHPSWSWADHAQFPAWSDLVSEFERRVKRSAKTTFIGVHFGNAPEDPARVGKMLDAYPNLYVDTAARVPELGRKADIVRKVILDHVDRVLFGTDLQLGTQSLVLGSSGADPRPKADEIDRFFASTWRFFETADKGFDHPTPIQGRWKIDGIELPHDALEKVYHANAERLLGLPAMTAPAPSAATPPPAASAP